MMLLELGLVVGLGLAVETAEPKPVPSILELSGGGSFLSEALATTSVGLANVNVVEESVEL